MRRADAEAVATTLESVGRADRGREFAVIVRTLHATRTKLNAANERVVGRRAARTGDNVTACRKRRSDVRCAHGFGRVTGLGDLISFFPAGGSPVAVHTFADRILSVEDDMSAALEVVRPVGDRSFVFLVVAFLGLAHDHIGFETSELFVEHKIHDPTDGIRAIGGGRAAVHDVHAINESLRNEIRVDLAGWAAGRKAPSIEQRQRTGHPKCAEIEEIGAAIPRAAAIRLPATRRDRGELFQPFRQIDRRHGQERNVVDDQDGRRRSKRARALDVRSGYAEGLELEDFAGGRRRGVRCGCSLGVGGRHEAGTQCGQDQAGTRQP